MNEMGGACGTLVEIKRQGVKKTLAEKPERKSPLGRPRSLWDNNTKMDLKQIGWKGVD
jgi:hypothetical protein